MAARIQPRTADCGFCRFHSHFMHVSCGLHALRPDDHHRRPAILPVEHAQPPQSLHQLGHWPKSPIGFRNPQMVLLSMSEEVIGKKMDYCIQYARQGVGGFLYVDFFQTLKHRPRECASVCVSTVHVPYRIFAPTDDMLLRQLSRIILDGRLS